VRPRRPYPGSQIVQSSPSRVHNKILPKRACFSGLQVGRGRRLRHRQH
jgi:hypothetical protein